jgi:hypothetical protein
MPPCVQHRRVGSKVEGSSHGLNGDPWRADALRMSRAIRLALLFLLLTAVPAAAELRVVDGQTGAARTLVRGDVLLEGCTEDGSGLVVTPRTRGARRVGLDGSVTRRPHDVGGSAGPGGSRLERRRGVPDTPTAPVDLRASDGRLVASFPLGWKFDTASIVWSPDGRRVALGFHPGVLVLDAATGATLLDDEGDFLEEHEPQAFSPDGSELLLIDDDVVLRATLNQGSDPYLRVWRVPRRCFEPSAYWGPAGIMVVACGRIHVLAARRSGSPGSGTRSGVPAATRSPTGSTCRAAPAWRRGRASAWSCPGVPRACWCRRACSG